MADEVIKQNTMLYVGGSGEAFRCECGANVFTHLRDERGNYWECHGCYACYRGELNEPPVAAEKGDEA